MPVILEITSPDELKVFNNQSRVDKWSHFLNTDTGKLLMGHIVRENGKWERDAHSMAVKISDLYEAYDTAFHEFKDINDMNAEKSAIAGQMADLLVSILRGLGLGFRPVDE